MANPAILRFNNFAHGTLTATGTDTGFSVNNLIDYRTTTYWQAAAHGTNYITVESGDVLSADMLGIVKHNLYTASATITIEYWDNVLSSWVAIGTPFSPTSDECIIKQFTSKTSLKWRIKINTASVKAKIAVMMIGSKIEMPYPPEAPSAAYAETYQLLNSESKNNNFLGAIRRNSKYSIRHVYKSVTKTFYDTYLLPFWNAHAKLGYPFFYAMDSVNLPEGNFFARFVDGYEWNPQRSNLLFVDEINFDLIGEK